MFLTERDEVPSPEEPGGPEARRRPVAVVTGASRGIGLAVVHEFARSGYTVFALARSVQQLEAAAAVATAEGCDVRPVPMDIESEASRNEAVAAIFAATSGYGADVLVNNAGYGQFGPLEDIPVTKFRRQLEVNLVGVLAFTQPFLRGMRNRRYGRIVNVSSAAGRTATPFMGAYNASKFGLEGMSDALRLELYPFNVRVILIAPGPIRTGFGDAARHEGELHVDSDYAEYTRAWQSTRRASDRLSRSPESVGRIILGAVLAANPRPRYTITVTARIGAIARRIVPDRVIDWALRRAMGLHRSPSNW